MTQEAGQGALACNQRRAAAEVCRSLFLDAPALVATQVSQGTLWTPSDAPLELPGSAVVVMGAFDGLHLGHRALIEAALADARARGVACVAVTFDPDPSELLLGANAQSKLLSVADRVRGLASLGVDGVLVLDFTHQLAACPAEEFMREVLGRMLHVVSVHVGSNFRFGAKGAGNVQTLRALGSQEGFSVGETPLLLVEDERVSSTRIRELLAQGGSLQAANELLGRCHFLRGTVEHGRGQGTSFGFPTANVRFPQLSCMPAQGVYAGYVTMGDNAWAAAINVGAPPTFSGPDELFLEANLIGFSGDLYGDDVCVSFVQWLRPSRPFNSTEELERVVLGNIDWVRTNLCDRQVTLGVARDH